MTQFMLCVPESASDSSRLQLRRLGPDESWLGKAARAVFPNEADVRVPEVEGGRSIDDVFTEAHDAVYNGRDFGTTRLASLLPEITKSCRAFAAWWGDEWSDLTVAHSAEEIIRETVSQLREQVGDVYLRWWREP